MPYKIILVGGARPNFVKIAPLWRQLNKFPDVFETKIVHTGQHYDYQLSQVFFDQFGLPKPDFFLNVGSGSHTFQTANIMLGFEKVLSEFKPDLVVVVGDVNSTIATALVAVKLGVLVAHVEAGLRSFDMDMPEEINRILTDRISSLLLVSEPAGMENLHNEGVAPSKITLVGNCMIDSLAYNLETIRNNGKTAELGLKPQEFVPITLHRPSNVDSPENLQKIIKIFKDAAKYAELVFPIHPRTSKNAESFGIMDEFRSIQGLRIIEPVGYFEFLNLVYNSKFVLTDSGGIQEETTFLGIPCITLRENTERPITITDGTNKLTGLDFDKIHSALEWSVNFDPKGYQHPTLWDGHAAERIIPIFKEFLS